MVTVESINCKPRLDYYRRDTGGITTTELWIGPVSRRAGVIQSNPGQTGVSEDEWHGQTTGLSLSPEGGDSWYDTKEMRSYLKSKEAGVLLDRICDGYSEEWDGNNWIGQWDKDARQALGELEAGIAANVRTIAYTVLTASEYFDGCYPDNLKAGTTDAEIAIMVQREEEATIENDTIILDDIEDELRDHRDFLSRTMA